MVLKLKTLGLTGVETRGRSKIQFVTLVFQRFLPRSRSSWDSHTLRDAEMYELGGDDEDEDAWHAEAARQRVNYEDGSTIGLETSLSYEILFRLVNILCSVDWMNEEAAERARKHFLSLHVGLKGFLLPLLDEWSMWLIVVTTGVGVGLIGAFLDILVAWYEPNIVEYVLAA